MKFENSAKFYDSIYAKKDYSFEVDLITEIIQSHNKLAKNILDVGCGTGTHSKLLAKNKFFNIVGIDKSSEMIKLAKYKSLGSSNINYEELDMLSLDRLKSKFDVVLAMFHVVNYLDRSKDLRTFFDLVSQILTPNGIFIFDTWNGVLCTKNNFGEKILTFNYNGERWQRLTKPELNESLQKVSIEHIYSNRETKSIAFSESHEISYWVASEILALSANFFECSSILESHEGNQFIEHLHWSPLFIMHKKVNLS